MFDTVFFLPRSQMLAPETRIGEVIDQCFVFLDDSFHRGMIDKPLSNEIENMQGTVNFENVGIFVVQESLHNVIIETNQSAK
jgi:hypothetical protein